MSPMSKNLLAGISPGEYATEGRGAASFILDTMDHLMKLNIALSFKSEARNPKSETIAK